MQLPPDLADAISVEAQQASDERLRLLYVAYTRAMDLLVLPELSWSGQQSWARAVDFKLDQLPELNIAHLPKKKYEKPADASNTQSLEQFRNEQIEVERAFARLRWINPNDGDPDIVAFEAPPAATWELTCGYGSCARCKQSSAASSCTKSWKSLSLGS